MIIQIYEIQSSDQAGMMVDLDVDHVGSVLISAAQWQDPEIKEAIQVVQAADRKSSLIPLFTDVDLISRAMDYYRPDIVHFCEILPLNDDDESLAPFIRRQQIIRQRFKDVEIMRSIPIGQAGHGHLAPSLKLARRLEPFSHWFLTDTLLAPNEHALDEDQPVCGYVGITGLTCDWDIARRLVRQSAIPVILAGGLGPGNVAAAIAKTQPAGVDSCTRTNKIDAQGRVIRFQKDLQKVKEMVERVKGRKGNIGNFI